MPTKTRMPAGRRAPSASRFARTPTRPQPRFTPRGKATKAAKPTGLAGVLSKLTSSSTNKGGSTSKAKPAAALLAAGAGALFGRKKLAQRKSNEGEMHTFPPQPPTAPVA